MKFPAFAIGLVLLPVKAKCSCPFLNEQQQQKNAVPIGHPPEHIRRAYSQALAQLPWDEVIADIKQLFRDSQDFWPADYGNYAPFFIRQGWHCAGTYRQSDGRGGCDGGNMRFDPVRSWEDNTNLDKTRRLLEPIKLKYGLGLSWGDLIELTATEAIRDMGGPVLGFCGGRIDFVDAAMEILLLGPTPEQDKFAPCETNGDCKSPLGANTLELIYINPQGPMGVPDVQGAAATIRDVFGRMGLDDRENVALIGGGHTYGKSHGACPAGAGPSPAEDENNPWPGECGTGVGNDAFTSGLEGPWATNPLAWNTEYFKNLIDYEWEVHVGPGGGHQWKVKGENSPQAPVAYPPDSKEKQDIMMFTTDIALANDTAYRVYVEEFANNLTAFDEAFAAVWYQLVTRDMGPVTRCVGPTVPPAQPFQYPLPDPPATLADMTLVEYDMDDLIGAQDCSVSEFVRLAWQCASTFRVTDYKGGCNGARIRFSPGKDWEPNKGLDKTTEKLNSIKEKYDSGLSWADLIVLAGNVAIKHSGAPDNLPFCPGRTDAVDGQGWIPVEFGNSDYPASIDAMLELNERRGLSPQEFVALSWIYQSNKELSTKYLTDIMTSPDDKKDIMAEGLKHHPNLKVWTEYYIGAGDDVFVNDFALAWTKMMNADRFDGPTGNICDVPSIPNEENQLRSSI